MGVDLKWLTAWQARMETLMERRQEDMRVIAEEPTLNANSPDQLAALIWGKWKLKKDPRHKDTTKKRNSTSQGALEHLASVNPKSRVKVRDGHPFVDILFEYRRVAKLKSSYVDNLVEASLRAPDRRVHATANIHGTEVGRLSFTDPALQTVPRADDFWGRVVRSGITAAPGNVLVVMDYAQAEWRVFAAESKDPWLLEVFDEGRDLHSQIAKEMYGDVYTQGQRVLAKMFNFAWIYGGNEHSFAQDAGMPLDRARAWVRRYNSIMPVAVEWKQQQFHRAKHDGLVRTRTGRLRRFPLITQQNLDEVRKAAVHSVVAGGASDITLYAGIEADDMTLPLVLLVHDSLVLDVPEHTVTEVVEEMTEVMNTIAQEWYPEVSWKVDAKVGPTWAERPESIPDGLLDSLTEKGP
jgi:DNA polymerase-1